MPSTPFSLRALQGFGALAVAMSLSAVVAPHAHGSTERLEADLRSLVSGQGEVEIGEVSSGVLRSQVAAQALEFRGEAGERLIIDRYVVNGDYDSPDEVILEGLRLEDELSELALVEIERIVLGEPSRAVFPLDGSLAPQDVSIATLAIDDVIFDFASELARELFDEADVDDTQARITIARVRGEGLSHAAIDRFEVADVSGVGESLGEFGAGSFTLASLVFEGLQGLDTEEQQRLDALVLSDLVIDAERLVGRLARLSVDGDMSDGEGGVVIDDFQADLARMIELAPEEERAQLRMASNVLTDGSGNLRIDAALLGNWEEGETQSLITSDSQVTVHDALRLGFDIELPVVLPEGISPAAVFADAEVLELATLLGGNLRLILNEEGLFGRMATLGAAMEGITESQYIEQARTQAEGFGMMFGPQVQQFLLGLVSLAEGTAEELEVALTLPAESNLETYTGDPLSLPERLEMRVETR
ncbi:hypothetical protein FHR95_003415 [Halomonas fontilapidosi]|uniref:DUF945 domain-containing protein n=1 Tax=Halomonas fontilapidosi TaxID=616675 RepID=A0A7W5H0Z5_9GAMM|nr:hypothetical protein [Halomonas fontilapidosi]MBB3185822.1 hypothetical protein [Halomonas fontilapidosi]